MASCCLLGWIKDWTPSYPPFFLVILQDQFIKHLFDRGRFVTIVQEKG